MHSSRLEALFEPGFILCQNGKLTFNLSKLTACSCVCLPACSPALLTAHQPASAVITGSIDVIPTIQNHFCILMSLLVSCLSYGVMPTTTVLLASTSSYNLSLHFQTPFQLSPFFPSLPPSVMLLLYLTSSVFLDRPAVAYIVQISDLFADHL